MFYRVEMKGVFLSYFWYNLCNIIFSGSTTTLSKSGSRNFTLLFVSRLGLVLVVLKRDDGGVRGGEGQQKKNGVSKWTERASMLLGATLFFKLFPKSP